MVEGSSWELCITPGLLMTMGIYELLECFPCEPFLDEPCEWLSTGRCGLGGGGERGGTQCHLGPAREGHGSRQLRS